MQSPPANYGHDTVSHSIMLLSAAFSNIRTAAAAAAAGSAAINASDIFKRVLYCGRLACAQMRALGITAQRNSSLGCMRCAPSSHDRSSLACAFGAFAPAHNLPASRDARTHAHTHAVQSVIHSLTHSPGLRCRPMTRH